MSKSEINYGSVTVNVDARGSLYALEFSKLPFKPARLFWIWDVPTGVERGGHAHKKCRQIFLMLSGSCKINMAWPDGTRGSQEIYPGCPLLVEPWTWVTLQYFTDRAVLMVLCSRPYEAEDYIKSRQEFSKRGTCLKK